MRVRDLCHEGCCWFYREEERGSCLTHGLVSWFNAVVVVLWGRRMNYSYGLEEWGGEVSDSWRNQPAPFPPTPIFSCPQWWSQTVVSHNFHSVDANDMHRFLSTLFHFPPWTVLTTNGTSWLWQHNPPFDNRPTFDNQPTPTISSCGIFDTCGILKCWFCGIASENHRYWAHTRSRTLIF